MVTGGAVRWLTGVSVLLMGVVAVSHRQGMTAGLFSYAILPLGAMVLPVLVWSRAREGWKIVTFHSPWVGYDFDVFHGFTSVRHWCCCRWCSGVVDF